MMASFGDVFVDPLSSGLFPAVFGCVCVHVERDDAHHRVRIIGFDLGQVAGCRDWFAVSTHPLAASWAMNNASARSRPSVTHPGRSGISTV